jgi:hypothetical protein
MLYRSACRQLGVVPEEEVEEQMQSRSWSDPRQRVELPTLPFSRRQRALRLLRKLSPSDRRLNRIQAYAGIVAAIGTVAGVVIMLAST